MKEEKILENLNRIIGEDEASSLIDDNIEIPIPKRIRDMVTQAQIELKREKANEKSSGLLDKLADLIAPVPTSPSVAFGADGTEEEEESEDPLKELLDENEKDNNEE